MIFSPIKKLLVLGNSIVEKEKVEASCFQMGLLVMNKHLTNCSVSYSLH